MVIIFVLTQLLFAQNNQDSEDLVKKYLAVIKGKEVESNLLEQVSKGACKPDETDPDLASRNNKVLKCFKDQLATLKEDEIKNFSKSIELHNYDIEVTKNSESIRSYLSERLETALYGEKLDPKKMGDPNYVKKLKMVGQDEFLRLYKTQISKNILLEISQYCLETLRDKDGKPLDPGKFNFPKPTEADYISFFSTFQEVTLETNKTSSDELAKITKDEFNKGPIFLKQKYLLCVQSVKHMCDRYESKNKTVTGTDLSKDNDSNGRKACILSSKLREYRRVIAATDVTLEDFKKFTDSSGFQYGGGFYTGNVAGKTVNDLTTVTSEEIKKTVDKDDAELEKFKECETKNFEEPECEKYIASGGEEAFRKLESDFHLATETKSRDLEALKEDDLKKYLETNGMKDQLEKYNKNELSEADIKKILTEKFKAERLAVIAEIRDQYSKKSVKKDPNATIGQTETDLKDETKQDLEFRKERLSNLFHYSNIITSYLEVESGGDKKTSNLIGLKKEKEALEKSEEEQDLKYFNQLEEGQDLSQDTGEMINVNLNVIDTILGNTGENDLRLEDKKKDKK
jgi:hypothetical protein